METTLLIGAVAGGLSIPLALACLLLSSWRLPARPLPEGDR